LSRLNSLRSFQDAFVAWRRTVAGLKLLGHRRDLFGQLRTFFLLSDELILRDQWVGLLRLGDRGI
jgi:hypothetical protein